MCLLCYVATEDLDYVSVSARINVGAESKALVTGKVSV